MTILDRFFLIMFSRLRRSSPSLPIKNLWIRACAATYELLVYPLGAIACLYFLLTKIVVGQKIPLSNDAVLAAQLVGGACLVGAMYYLDHRFRPFLLKPPPLPPVEAQEDRRFIWQTRLLGAGLFCVVATAAYLLQLKFEVAQ